MLAERKLPDTSALRYPLYASPKLDGYRAMVVNGKLLSRALKPVPNAFTAARFGLKSLNGLDGELILGDPAAKDVFNKTGRALRTHDGEPDVRFYCFDLWDSKESYANRNRLLARHCEDEHIVPVASKLVLDEKELLEFEAETLEQGYEGLILRSPDGLYKFGRSTMKEGGMLKLKRFTDDEAKVVGVYEEMHNDNEAHTNELGRTFRSTHQENLVGKGTAGGFLCTKDGALFKCGTGLTDEAAAMWWARRQGKPIAVKLDGATLVYWELKKSNVFIKFKHFAHGAKDKPRHPVFLGERDSWDVS